VTLVGDGRGGAPVDHEAAPEGPSAFWEALISRVQHGDREAEADVARLFHHRVLMLASVRLHGSDAAQDVAQDTILAVLRALRTGAIREPYNLPGYVLGTARNLVNNHHRKQSGNRELQVDPPVEPGAGPEVLAAADGERRRLVRDALKQLNWLDRKILVLTLVEGMHPREIAPVVGLKPEVVRTRKARAVKAVSEAIQNVTRTPRPDHVDTRGSRT